MTDIHWELTQAAISLIALAYVSIHCLGRQRRDAFRCDIRAIRDSLFDYMADSGRQFTDQGYVATRQMLNGTLRMSNTLGVALFVITVDHHIKMVASGHRIPLPFEATHDSELRARLKDAHRQAHERLMHFLFLEGFAGLFIRGLVYLLGLVRLLSKLRARFAKTGDQFLLEAARVGASDSIAFGNHFAKAA